MPLPTPAWTFLEGCPIAVAVISTSTPPRLVAANASWRALWLADDPELAAASGTPLERFLSLGVDLAAGETLRRAIAEAAPIDMAFAVDRLGPALLHLRGCSLDEHYLLALDRLIDPDRLAAAWPYLGDALEPAREFRYTASLATAGDWAITAAVPDFRPVLGLAAASTTWLDQVVIDDRRALRSRHLQLVAGLPQRLRYGIEAAGGRQVILEDEAVPVRHPTSGEVIGLAGRVRLVDGRSVPAPTGQAAAGAPDRIDAPPGTSPPATAAGQLEDIVRGLDLVGMAALVLTGDGRVGSCNQLAAGLLGQPPAALVGQPAEVVLGIDAETARASLAASLDTAEARAAVDPSLPPPDAEPNAAASSFNVSFRQLELDDTNLLLATLAPATSGKARFREALYFDDVTGLPNRFLCLDRLRQNICRTAAHSGHLAVLVLTIGRWSLVERSFGRATAQALLAALAERVTAVIGGLDTAAMIGEARFAVIAGNLASTEEAARIAQSLLEQLATPIPVDEREIGLNGAIGIAVYPADGDDAETLLTKAEAALDRPSVEPTPGYQFYTNAMNAASSDRLLLEQQLAEAVSRDEFLLLYQPQISFASSRIVGMEALIRWRHPELGMVPPAEFIPLAEETGAIVQIGEWVLESSCRELQRWFAAGVAPLRLAINISGRQFNDANLVPGVRRTLEATGFPPHLLELELTESVIMEDVVDAARRLGDLHALGINLAVDDFGTGYSSLSYLKRFPIRSLKVDRSFVRDIAHNESSASIARAIIAFGSALGLKVIAEGVESHDQYEILRGCGCDELQGYLFSRPVPADDARKLATERRQLPLVRT